MKNTPSVKVTQPEINPVPVEILATSIQQIADAMKAINGTRVRREAIVILIQSKTTLARRDIELVLNNLENLAQLWLKPNFIKKA